VTCKSQARNAIGPGLSRSLHHIECPLSIRAPSKILWMINAIARSNSTHLYCFFLIHWTCMGRYYTMPLRTSLVLSDHSRSNSYPIHMGHHASNSQSFPCPPSNRHYHLSDQMLTIASFVVSLYTYGQLVLVIQSLASLRPCMNCRNFHGSDVASTRKLKENVICKLDICIMPVICVPLT
jgi:hypothetical protein